MGYDLSDLHHSIADTSRLRIHGKPLDCDCGPGCWGRHARDEDWTIVVASEYSIDGLRHLINTEKLVTYGNYVRLSGMELAIQDTDELRVLLKRYKEIGGTV